MGEIPRPEDESSGTVEQTEKKDALKSLMDYLQVGNLTTEDLKDLYERATEMVGDNYYVQQKEKSILPKDRKDAEDFKELVIKKKRKK